MVTHGNDEEKRSRPEKSPEDSQAPLNEHEAVPQGADPQFALPASNQDSLCPTNIPGIRVDYFRPVEAVVELAGNHTPGSPEFELLREELSRLPPFLRVE
ncbi:MAG: hypothetical protein KDD70_08355, partial [Bdellovibrionales bacterium]|nr:hypothetical protein [Bdellovibrionales bacterium]